MSTIKKLKKTLAALAIVALVIFIVYYFLDEKNTIRYAALNIINGDKFSIGNNQYKVNTKLSSILNVSQDLVQLTLVDVKLKDKIVLVQKSKYDIGLLIEKGAVAENPLAQIKGCKAFKFLEPEKVGFKTLILHANDIEIVTEHNISIEKIKLEYCQLISEI